MQEALDAQEEGEATVVFLPNDEMLLVDEDGNQMRLDKKEAKGVLKYVEEVGEENVENPSTSPRGYGPCANLCEPMIQSSKS